eukprot:NODE_28_length_38599_cov_0.791792.p15 type:complete len:154 gc:universal NODE_28_length_38599_cov_0.791792:15203-14742(-)
MIPEGKTKKNSSYDGALRGLTHHAKLFFADKYHVNQFTKLLKYLNDCSSSISRSSDTPVAYRLEVNLDLNHVWLLQNFGRSSSLDCKITKFLFSSIYKESDGTEIPYLNPKCFINIEMSQLVEYVTGRFENFHKFFSGATHSKVGNGMLAGDF